MSTHDNTAAQRTFGGAVNSGDLGALDDLGSPDLTGAENDVSFAYTVTGTHQGPMQRHGATGKSVKIRSRQISRFSGGKLVERWGSSDGMSMMTQLGLARA